MLAFGSKSLLMAQAQVFSLSEILISACCWLVGPTLVDDRAAMDCFLEQQLIGLQEKKPIFNLIE